MLNSALIQHHFTLANGRLYRQLAGGAVRPVTLVVEGRLMSRVLGTVYYGADIAWVLYYGSSPMFPVFCLNGDPHDLSQENVVAARVKRLRFRFKESRAGFRHSLNPSLYFKTLIACKDDWVGMARRYYAADHENVRCSALDCIKSLLPRTLRDIRPQPLGLTLATCPRHSLTKFGFRQPTSDGRIIAHRFPTTEPIESS